ncbi:MAG: precorrin-6y C5,15-methyltransferase (decarboxylating) subunit CbiE [Actinomycetales bacterium]|nr:MAG: precorrin-6y C5,15-methyltransferase (decarboxylating) subunit CbiE [Actinomycetales bacterium]
MIIVHGLLGRPTPQLEADADRSDWVVGGTRHLDALHVAPERRITLGALRPAIERISGLPSGTRVTIVASGDPLYFGVVRALRARGIRPAVVTAPSSIATAFAAVGLPWDDAVVVSAHGRPIGPALNLARAFPKVAVFTGGDHGIRELAAGLAGQRRWFVLAERLGEPDERVRVLDSEQAHEVEPMEPNVVLVLAAHPDDPDRDWDGTVARPQRADRSALGAVTPAAALAFARLLPEPGELLWARGPLAGDLAALAGWAGAAITLDDPPEAPDLVLTDSSSDIGDSARAVVVTGPAPDPLPEGYHWAREVVDGHQVTTGVRT